MAISENWSRENIAWAAGLFEGEGCISGRPQTAQLQLGMTDEDAVRKLHSILGVGTVCGPYKSKTLATAKPSWKWVCGGARDVQAVLAAMWPFLMSRRRKKAEETIIALSRLMPHPKYRTHCLRGHPFDDKNTRHSKDGRVCRACMRWHASKVRERKKQERGGELNGH